VKKWLTLAETAALLGVTKRTVRRRVSDGHLTAYRLEPGRLIRIDEAEVEGLLRQIPAAGPIGEVGRGEGLAR
jgi:excisionase family DNA binding protein